MVVSVIKPEIPLPRMRLAIMAYATQYGKSIPAGSSSSDTGSPSHRDPSRRAAERVRRRILASFAFPPHAISCRLRFARLGQMTSVEPAPLIMLLCGLVKPAPARTPRGAWMHEPKGRYLPLAGPRRFIGDLVHFALDTLGAGQPDVRRHCTCGTASEAFRTSLMGVPVHEGLRLGRQGPRPVTAVDARIPMAAALRASMDELLLAIERTYQGEEGVFVGIFRAPSISL